MQALLGGHLIPANILSADTPVTPDDLAYFHDDLPDINNLSQEIELWQVHSPFFDFAI